MSDHVCPCGTRFNITYDTKMKCVNCERWWYFDGLTVEEANPPEGPSISTTSDTYKIAEGNIESLEEQGSELMEQGFIPTGSPVLLPKSADGYLCFAQAFYRPGLIDDIGFRSKAEVEKGDDL
jgi:hypothetical protein